MSVADDFSANTVYNNGVNGAPAPAAAPAHAPPTDPAPVADNHQHGPLHRIAEVRRQQSVSVRSVARRMGVPPEQVRRQEDPACDLKVSELQQWQQALEVPIADLLVEQEAPLSPPVLNRARMLRVMKTVKAIAEGNQDPGVGRLTKMLESQLLEIMPELAEVGAWHSVGQRRTQDEMGRVAERPVSDSFARDALG